MDQLLSTLAIAIVAFASTNIDDLFLLSSLFVDAEFRTQSVIIGHFLGMSLLVLISILAALDNLDSALVAWPARIGSSASWHLSSLEAIQQTAKEEWDRE